MEQYEVLGLLPNVGDKLMRKPTIINPAGAVTAASEDEYCEVIEVNANRLWFRVRFKKTGFVECYKVPRLKNDMGSYVE